MPFGTTCHFIPHLHPPMYNFSPSNPRWDLEQLYPQIVINGDESRDDIHGGGQKEQKCRWSTVGLGFVCSPGAPGAPFGIISGELLVEAKDVSRYQFGFCDLGEPAKVQRNPYSTWPSLCCLLSIFFPLSTVDRKL